VDEFHISTTRGEHSLQNVRGNEEVQNNDEFLTIGATHVFTAVPEKEPKGKQVSRT
jgi:hypothetical protein